MERWGVMGREVGVMGGEVERWVERWGVMGREVESDGWKCGSDGWRGGE